MSVEYYLPTPEPVDVASYDLALDHRRPRLRIGLLANGFPDGEAFLTRLSDALTELVPGAEFRLETKGRTDQLSACVQDPLLSAMAADCDGVIIAWGHCGSCTSGVTRDGIAFAKRGIPSVTLICDIFWDYALWLDGALGMEDLPKVRIPYPVAGTGESNHRAVARRIAPEVLARFARH
jgi:hypothetical protein